MNKGANSAFTLIELLIVVLIIAILAAIAIPNFMEFQTRAKVARCKSDMRTIATALEAYCVDEGTYPGPQCDGVGGIYHYEERLTTPIAYLSNPPSDPFGDTAGVRSNQRHILRFEYGAGREGYFNSQNGRGDGPWGCSYPNDVWLLDSAGPDLIECTISPNSQFNTLGFPWLYATAGDEREMMGLVYDPTNGTNSRGQIQRTGGVPLSRRPLNVWSAAVTR